MGPFGILVVDLVSQSQMVFVGGGIGFVREEIDLI
jgi:hypothetical protein